MGRACMLDLCCFSVFSLSNVSLSEPYYLIPHKEVQTLGKQMAQSGLKANYALSSKHEAFYTGGKVQFSKNGDFMFCGCGNLVKVIGVGDGKISETIGQEDDPEVTCFIVSPDD